jgi:hypothetical protein
MATYLELYDEYQSDADLRNKVAVACCDKARALIALASPTATQITWASNALANPTQAAAKLLPYVLVVNKASTVSQIKQASDATIQTNVDTAVDKLIAGGIT